VTTTGGDVVFDRLEGHEQVVFCSDPASGLRAIIAIHSTALGPALGGTRCRPYPSVQDALDDVLHLSQAMTSKNALAGLDHGGGKAVIIGDPATCKTEPLLRAYGRFVQGLGGRYVTAGDMGVSVSDLDIVGRESQFVTGRSVVQGGGGDSGVLTAYGVLQGMRAAATHRWGSPSLASRTVGVVGLGKVGRRLVGHLVADGALVVGVDTDPAAVERVRIEYPETELLETTSQLLARPLDVLAPCAAGGLIDDDVAARVETEIICGGANNQLAEPALAQVLATRGVLYAPDFLVNAGGVIQVADELVGYSEDRARSRVEHLYDTTLAVLERAAQTGVTPEVAAEGLVADRIAGVSRLRTIWNRPG
jgi:valine dehydrogenase (NAD+)